MQEELKGNQSRLYTVKEKVMETSKQFKELEAMTNRDTTKVSHFFILAASPQVIFLGGDFFFGEVIGVPSPKKIA